METDKKINELETSATRLARQVEVLQADFEEADEAGKAKLKPRIEKTSAELAALHAELEKLSPAE